MWALFAGDNPAMGRRMKLDETAIRRLFGAHPVV
jgi:hypothetical protein